jgi:hypothetical protein
MVRFLGKASLSLALVLLAATAAEAATDSTRAVPPAQDPVWSPPAAIDESALSVADAEPAPSGQTIWRGADGIIVYEQWSTAADGSFFSHRQTLAPDGSSSRVLLSVEPDGAQTIEWRSSDPFGVTSVEVVGLDQDGTTIEHIFTVTRAGETKTLDLLRDQPQDAVYDPTLDGTEVSDALAPTAPAPAE